MIFRPIKFQVMYRTGDKWSRDDVVNLFMNAEQGAYQVQTANVGEFPLDPMNTALVQFTGQFDKVGAEIYHAHLLKDEAGDIWKVIFFNGKFALQHGEDEPVELDMQRCMVMTVIGDEFNDSVLTVPANAEAVIEKAIKEPDEKSYE